MSVASDSLNFSPPPARPQSMEELTERPLFKAPLDPKQHKLIEVLVGYSFNKQVPCGLSTCQQRHYTGLLVKTASGEETNIGHVCGKKQFGDDFTAAHTKYQSSVARHDALSRLDALRKQTSSVQNKVRNLTDGGFGVHWVFALRDELKKRLGVDGFNHFCLRARRQDYRVTRMKELKGFELQQAIENTGKRRDEVRYVYEPLGTLTPLKWLHWDFRAALIDGISEPFKALEKVDAEALDTRTLSKHLKVFSDWENRLAEVEATLSEARTFFAPENLSIMQQALEEFLSTRKSEPLIVGKQGQLLSHKGPSSGTLDGWDRTPSYKALSSGITPQ